MFDQLNLTYSVKDKPEFTQASKDYKSMYCMCKVCGLKFCKCKSKYSFWLTYYLGSSKGNQLPFSKLKVDKSTNKVVNPAQTPLSYKASTLRAVTAEPIHPYVKKYEFLVFYFY